MSSPGLTQAVKTAPSCVGSCRLHASIFMHANAKHTVTSNKAAATTSCCSPGTFSAEASFNLVLICKSTCGSQPHDVCIWYVATDHAHAQKKNPGRSGQWPASQIPTDEHLASQHQSQQHDRSWQNGGLRHCLSLLKPAQDLAQNQSNVIHLACIHMPRL